MKLVRQSGRVALAAASVSTLMLVAACGGGTSGGNAGGQASGGSTANWDEKGPIQFVSGKDTSNIIQKMIDKWNASHPNEKATFIELSDSADQQRASMIQNAQVKGADYSILNVDVVWTAEFAANGYVEELPKDKVDLNGYLKPTVDSATYFNKLYAMPVTSDGGLLFYRKDLLQKAGISAPPTTFDEMWKACDTIKQKAPEAKDMSCYGGQYEKYEGLTVNTAEAIDSAGGHIMDASGKKPTVNTPEAQKGVDAIKQGFDKGYIPKEAITWKEEQGRTAFQEGKLIFHRNWPYVYAKFGGEGSKVVGKFADAPLPGVSGKGVSSLGGHNYAVSKFAKNKGSALEFMKFMSGEEVQKEVALNATLAPTRESLYSDSQIQQKLPYMKNLKESISGANPRPKAIKYGDVTLAVQDSVYAVLQGQKDSKSALSELQTKLEGLVK